MPRQPKNVHVFLYRKNADGETEYAVFQRSEDAKNWQGISGGLEKGETYIKAALREAHEEAGTPLDAVLSVLETVTYVPSDVFGEQPHWGKDVVVVPMRHFAMEYNGEIILSREHARVEWLAFDEAHERVYYHDAKNALWELNQRLIRGNMLRA